MKLTSEKITLRKFSEKDAPRLALLCNNIKIWNNVRDYLPHPYSEKDGLAFVRAIKDEDPQATFAIDYENELAGCIGIQPQKDVYRLTAEIGFWIGEPFWGKGIAPVAIRLVAKYVFEELGLVRIYACCFDFNTASQKALIKAGFHREGVAEKAIIKNDRIGDEIRFAMIRKTAD
ncbi:GNAT family N-acetyltransferase [Poritiphilus flavus]|uniref:GNAT family N-acetyltransferase n=1 Tax=Poritiphilus flavus TaxID=2697053 RepID=A0A6L9EJL8_9FLAO|nr:GNAT family protein [Poritiphilus flavus]NAS14389.1 GNAT family N-acetyltransferase [Poritiphilus flavus]